MTQPLIRAERYVAGGEALGRDADGRVVFLRGAMAGETVAVELTEVKPDWSRGFVTEVHTASVDRVPPPCAQRVAGCGGCDWQHIADATQLAAKADIVADALRRTAKLPDADVWLGSAVSPFGYRTTIRVVGDADGRAAFRQEHSHDTVAASGCLVAHPSLTALVDAVSIPVGVEVTLRVSAATGEATALWDRRGGDVVGLPDWVGTGPARYLHEVVAGVKLRVSAGSFFQSGPAAAELLIEAVSAAAPELASAETVLDAYAGVGLFAAAATRSGSQVVTVESSRAAVSDCRVNMAGRSTVIELGEFGRWRRPASIDQIDVAIADPARSGLGKPGVAALLAADAPVAVLVSCDPVALARDAALLVRGGYRHAGSTVYDLFPHTHHVEVVTRFERSGR